MYQDGVLKSFGELRPDIPCKINDVNIKGLTPKEEPLT